MPSKVVEPVCTRIRMCMYSSFVRSTRKRLPLPMKACDFKCDTRPT
jgi:hypothetical protein